MAFDQGGGGNWLRILGIVYLVRRIRERRRMRREQQRGPESGR